MANHAGVVELLDDERVELERLLRSQTAASGLVRRARAVLLMADGQSGAEVARLTGYTPVQISRIRHRFIDERTSGLSDKPRSGRPHIYGREKSAEIVALTLQPPPEGLSHWSTRELAQKAGVSHTTIHRIWRAHDLQPHRVQTFKFSRDRHLEEKISDIVGLYLNPPTNAFVVSVDEKTQIQALNRTQPLLPLRPGIPARQTHDYKRNGLTSLYAALEVATGKVIGECSPTHRGSDFLRFLQKVARSFPRRQLHVIVDNSSTHSTPDVKVWLAAHPRVSLHFTPTSASWMNLVESWFGLLTRKSVRRGSFDSVAQLVRHIEAFIAHWNVNPTPFIWTKSADEILKKARRAN
jgi:transcriptional regulator with XRE-family HTH domain